jgi:hypothetical protein
MPALTFLTVVDLALIGLLFVANATLPESGLSYRNTVALFEHAISPSYIALRAFLPHCLKEN